MFVRYLDISRKQFCDPVYKSLQNTYTGSENRNWGTVKNKFAQGQTPECRVKIRGMEKTQELPPPQQMMFMNFLPKPGLSGSACRVVCRALFGLWTGVARVEFRFGWLCWNCACVEPSGGASSPMLFLFTAFACADLPPSRISLGLLPGGPRVAPGFGRSAFKRW